jgi:hypothetical protein
MLEPLPESKTVYIHAIEGDCNEHKQSDRAGEGLGGNERPFRHIGESSRTDKGSAGLVLGLCRYGAQSAKTGTVPLDCVACHAQNY